MGKMGGVRDCPWRKNWGVTCGAKMGQAKEYPLIYVKNGVRHMGKRGSGVWKYNKSRHASAVCESRAATTRAAQKVARPRKRTLKRPSGDAGFRLAGRRESTPAPPRSTRARAGASEESAGTGWRGVKWVVVEPRSGCNTGRCDAITAPKAALTSASSSRAARRSIVFERDQSV